MASTTPPTVRFGRFELNLETSELSRDGARVHLQLQPAKVLVLLASRPGRLVTRQELRHHLWGDAAVESDIGLNVCIRHVRSALGDRAEAPTFIETLPRQGYRFIAPVSDREDTARRPARRPRCRWLRAAVMALSVLVAATQISPENRHVEAPSPPGRRLLAVIPFQGIGLGPGGKCFREGLTEEVVTELARLDPGRLGIIALGTARHPRGSQESIARVETELGVDFVVAGSVRRNRDQVRIVARLIRVRDQAHLWAGRFDRASRDASQDPLAVQLDIAEQISRAVLAELRQE